MINKIHSYLFVPANKKMLSKIRHGMADAIIIDLEDAVLQENKDIALADTFEFLNNYIGKMPIFVRLNNNRIEIEIEKLRNTSIAGYMIPKAEDVCFLENVFDLDSKKIIALVESPMGIVNVPIFAKSEKVYAIAFGAEDYTCSASVHNIHENLLYQKSRIVNYSKAYNKPCIDTMSLNVRDRNAYKLEAQKTMDIGFDSKLAIHPMQVEVINEVYSVDDANYLRRIVEIYTNSGEAVLEIDGKVYEKPHIDTIIKKLESMEG